MSVAIRALPGASALRCCLHSGVESTCCWLPGQFGTVTRNGSEEKIPGEIGCPTLDAPEKIDPDAVPSPYPGRTEPLPWNRSEVTAEWLGRTVANKYPGVAAHSLEVIQLFDSHTTKMRVAVDWNESGDRKSTRLNSSH